MSPTVRAEEPEAEALKDADALGETDSKTGLGESATGLGETERSPFRRLPETEADTDADDEADTEADATSDTGEGLQEAGAATGRTQTTFSPIRRTV